MEQIGDKSGNKFYIALIYTELQSNFSISILLFKFLL